jgi:hypothetical protein
VAREVIPPHVVPPDTIRLERFRERTDVLRPGFNKKKARKSGPDPVEIEVDDYGLVGKSLLLPLVAARIPRMTAIIASSGTKKPPPRIFSASETSAPARSGSA